VTVLLVRHARAGQRQRWKGDDRLRPLSKRGHAQALGLVGPLTAAIGKQKGPVVIVSSPWVRCVQTVAPLADALGVKVVEAPELGEGQGGQAVEFVRLRSGPTVFCTHGDVVGEILDDARRHGVDLGPHPTWPKGCTWELRSRAGKFQVARYFAPPL
jgi:Histidine phosphatase superfamily (branch 1)